ncbi:hypothetical protein [Sphingomonas kyungheensis]|uniref:Uncharacterized protein n=1 Tax=Sphingomonas kyungheensis TaxID=1069987 RepID=A0ABU8H431_9SPHN
MTGAESDALDEAMTRLTHAEAILQLLAEPLDTNLGEALRGVHAMLSDCGNRLDRILTERLRE